MRTSKLHVDSDVVSTEAINGRRASPLRISKESHAIHKSSSFPAAASFSRSHPAKRPPVIIYTQSPRIIHTQAHEFMTLVQKLTGLDRDAAAAEDKEDQNNIINHAKSDESESTTDDCSVSNDDVKDINAVAAMIKNNNNNFVGYEENESSSVLTTDDKLVTRDSSPVSSMYNNVSSNPYLMDGPTTFLAPGSTDFYCSSSRSNSMFGSAANHYPISPSFMDIMKGFPEY